jgi:hypothetical protein
MPLPDLSALTGLAATVYSANAAMARQQQAEKNASAMSLQNWQEGMLTRGLENQFAIGQQGRAQAYGMEIQNRRLAAAAQQQQTAAENIRAMEDLRYRRYMDVEKAQQAGANRRADLAARVRLLTNDDLAKNYQDVSGQVAGLQEAVRAAADDADGSLSNQLAGLLAHRQAMQQELQRRKPSAMQQFQEDSIGQDDDGVWKPLAQCKNPKQLFFRGKNGWEQRNGPKDTEGDRVLALIKECRRTKESTDGVNKTKEDSIDLDLLQELAPLAGIKDEAIQKAIGHVTAGEA